MPHFHRGKRGTDMTSQRSFLQAIIVVSLIWCGIENGVAFIATPAKFLSDVASLPILIDIGRKTFAVLEKVDCVFAAVLSSLTLAAPALNRITRAWLALPIVPFLVELLWFRPILDVAAQKVVAGLAPSDETLHVLYAGLVALQICSLICAALLAMTLLRKCGSAVPEQVRASDPDRRFQESCRVLKAR